MGTANCMNASQSEELSSSAPAPAPAVAAAAAEEEEEEEEREEAGAEAEPAAGIAAAAAAAGLCWRLDLAAGIEVNSAAAAAFAAVFAAETAAVVAVVAAFAAELVLRREALPVPADGAVATAAAAAGRMEAVLLDLADSIVVCGFVRVEHDPPIWEQRNGAVTRAIIPVCMMHDS